MSRFDLGLLLVAALTIAAMVAFPDLSRLPGSLP